MVFIKGNPPWNKGKNGIYTPDTLKRLSEVRVGTRASEETKKRMSEAHTNISEETRRKLSLVHKGKPLSKEHRKNLSLSMQTSQRAIKQIEELHRTRLGETFLEEHKKNISESRKRLFAVGELKIWNKGIKGEQVAWNKGIPCSEETKKKLSEIRKQQIVSGNITPWNKGNYTNVCERCGRTYPTVACKVNTTRFCSRACTWNGGKKATWARSHSKRDRELGYVPLNEWEVNTPGFVGHHLDREHVLFIPEELHKKVWHMQRDQASMDRINELVMKWYAEYYGLDE